MILSACGNVPGTTAGCLEVHFTRDVCTHHIVMQTLYVRSVYNPFSANKSKIFVSGCDCLLDLFVLFFLGGGGAVQLSLVLGCLWNETDTFYFSDSFLLTDTITNNSTLHITAILQFLHFSIYYSSPLEFTATEKDLALETKMTLPHISAQMHQLLASQTPCREATSLKKGLVCVSLTSALIRTSAGLLAPHLPKSFLL